MFNKFFQFRNKIAIQNYDFELAEIWREAFKLAKSSWLQLVVADAIFIVVFTAFVWMPWLAKTFPVLENFRVNPQINTLPSYIQFYYSLSKELWPFLYSLFISFPVYLGLLLMSTHVAYGRPVSLQLLSHFINLRWWLIIVTLLVLVAFFTVPIGFFLFLFYKKSIIAGTMTQFHTFVIAVGLVYLSLLIMFSMTLNLIFLARQNIVDAFNLSWFAVKKHFLKITAMLLIWYVCQRIGNITYYISDIILFPVSYVAWALLYKKMFGEAGLAE